jgi:hypothetical protein
MMAYLVKGNGAQTAKSPYNNLATLHESQLGGNRVANVVS